MLKSHMSRLEQKMFIMKKLKTPGIFFALFSIVVFTTCTIPRTSIKTYVDPSINTSLIKSVGVFSLRNTAISPGESMQLDRTMIQTFQQKNKNVKILGPSETTRILNDANLVRDYSLFLEDFVRSGLPNTVTLNKIGSVLGVDAILQGSISDLVQRDARYGVTALTSLTFRYTLLSTQTGAILWEGYSSSSKEKTPAWAKAPPVYEVLEIAHKKVVSGLPVLGN